MTDLPTSVREYFAELGRKGAAGRDMSEIGRKGGLAPRRRQPRYCARCGEKCESPALAKAHCARKRGKK